MLKTLKLPSAVKPKTLAQDLCILALLLLATVFVLKLNQVTIRHLKEAV